MDNPLSADKLTNMFKTSSVDPLRITNREGTTVEFKESYSHAGMAQYFKTIAAFANNAGGYIIFGVGDKPRKLLGLKDKNLNQFENLKVEEFTKNLLDYFSTEIKWDHCTFEYKNMSFGVIYTYPLKRKPCICKKKYDATNTKYSLKESDIYYRYGGRSEKIRYEELFGIIDESRKLEERQWIDFVRKAAKIGIENTGLFDIDKGTITGGGGTIVLDENLLKKIAFIKEGEFVESKGKPALRLIGDIENINGGKLIMKEVTKKVVRAIEINDIVQAFLKNKPIEEPKECIKILCSTLSANYPIYFLIKQAGIDVDKCIEIIDSVTTRNNVKDKLIDRLNGKFVQQKNIPSSNTNATKQKNNYLQMWRDETVVIEEKELMYCIGAFFILTEDDIIKHKKYISEVLYDIYTDYYENAKSNVAADIRKAICRVDEVLYINKK